MKFRSLQIFSISFLILSLLKTFIYSTESIRFFKVDLSILKLYLFENFNALYVLVGSSLKLSL